MLGRVGSAALLALVVSCSVLGEESSHLPLLPREDVPHDDERASVLRLDLRRSETTQVLPEYQAKLPVFRSAKPSFSPEFIQAFANVVFGAQPDGVRHSRSLTFVKIGRPRVLLEFDHRRGCITITNRGFSYEAVEPAERTRLPQQQVERMARSWLTDHHLNYEGAELSKVIDNVPGAGCYTVMFARKIPELPYDMRGSRILVDVVPQGGFGTVLIEWPSLRLIGQYPIMSLDTAIEEINKGRGRVLDLERLRPIQGTVERARLAYSCSGGYVRPMYYCDVVVEEDGDESKVVVLIQAVDPRYLAVNLESDQSGNKAARRDGPPKHATGDAAKAGVGSSGSEAVGRNDTSEDGNKKAVVSPERPRPPRNTLLGARSADKSTREKAVGELLGYLDPGMTRTQIEKWLGPGAKVLNEGMRRSDPAGKYVVYFCQPPGARGTQMMVLHYEGEGDDWRLARVVDPHFRD